jgi:HSP20 family protein
MVMRYDPFREFDRLTPTRHRPRMMSMDAYRRGDRFIIHFDLPGVESDAIELTAEKNVLTLKAERSWAPAEGDEVLAAERPEGNFSRQVFLGDGLDLDRVEAHYDAGVLTVTIPVAETAKARQIPIARAGGDKVIDTTSKSP